MGAMRSLAEVYSGARVFVAPTRFAAGIPLKVYDAAAHGVPVVLTSVLATDLNWARKDEVLVADSAEEFSQACLQLHQDPNLWNAIRTNALRRVSVDCSPSRFDATLDAIMTTIATARN
jgi:glycosyltransferase involved in cell wall biosynthesis